MDKPKINAIKKIIYALPTYPVDKRKKTIQRLATETNTSPETVYIWMRDIDKVKEIYKPIIARVLKVSANKIFKNKIPATPHKIKKVK